MKDYYKQGAKKLLILFLKKLIKLQRFLELLFERMKETARRAKEERRRRADEAERALWRQEALKESFSQYSVIFWVKRKWTRTRATLKIGPIRPIGPMSPIRAALGRTNRLNPVQRTVAALVIFALLWQSGLSALAQEGLDPLARITTPEIKALESVNPELLKASSLEKEKEIQKAIEEESQKINYALGGLVPDTEEDKLKKEEVGILEKTKDALRGGLFSAPKPAEYTVIKFTKSRNPRVKQAALNAKEILRAKGLFESFYDEQAGEETEINVDLERGEDGLKPGKTPYSLILGDNFGEGMTVGDLSEEISSSKESRIPNTESRTNTEIQITNPDEILRSAQDDNGVVQDDNGLVPSNSAGTQDDSIKEETASGTEEAEEARILNPESRTNTEVQILNDDETTTDDQILNQVQDDNGVVQDDNIPVAETASHLLPTTDQLKSWIAKIYKVTTREGEKYLYDKTPEHKESVLFTPLGANPVEGVSALNKVLYKNAWQGMDVLKTVTATGVKEDIIIKNSSASNKIYFEVTTKGLQMRIEDGGLKFYDIFGNLKFETPAPFMADRFGNARDLEYKLVKDEGLINELKADGENQTENQESRIKNQDDGTTDEILRSAQDDNGVVQDDNGLVPSNSAGTQDDSIKEETASGTEGGGETGIPNNESRTNDEVQIPNDDETTTDDEILRSAQDDNGLVQDDNTVVQDDNVNGDEEIVGFWENAKDIFGMTVRGAKKAKKLLAFGLGRARAALAQADDAEESRIPNDESDEESRITNQESRDDETTTDEILRSARDDNAAPEVIDGELTDEQKKRNELIGDLPEGNSENNELTVYDEMVHKVAGYFEQAPYWVLAIFSDEQIKLIAEQLKFSLADEILRSAQDDNGLVQDDSKGTYSDEMLADINEERTYVVVIELDFTGMSFPIDLDPTTYIHLQDRGQATFAADFSQGGVHGDDGFMNGYGRMNRGIEPVQAGGTRIEDTDADDIVYVDPDGTKYQAGVATKGVWTLYSSGGIYAHYSTFPDAAVYMPASATFTEIWAGVILYAVTEVFKVVIDEGTASEIVNYIDCYDAATTLQQKVLLATGLSNSPHTVKIYVIKTKNVQITNTSTNVYFDFFEFYTSGNELAQKSSITINSRATNGLDFTSAKDSPTVSYSAQGNIPQNISGNEERGSFSTWVKTNFDWNGDTAPHAVWGDQNQQVYYQYNPLGNDDSGTDKFVGGVNNTQISSYLPKFGGSSYLFDWTTSDHIQLEDSEDWNFGSGDFTVDLWFKKTAPYNALYFGGQIGSAGSGAQNSCWFGLNASGNPAMNCSSGAANYSNAHPTAVADSDWHHVAFLRNGNNIYIALDGIFSTGTAVTGVTFNNVPYKFGVGRAGEYDDGYFSGYLDEFRVSKGVARWTANFTPPTTAYAVDGATKLLLHGDSPAGNFRYNHYNGTDWQTVKTRSDDYTAANSFSSGDVFHLAGSWDANSGVNLYVNNDKNSLNTTWTAQTTLGNLKIGGDEQTKLLLHGDGANLATDDIDSSGGGKTMTFAGDAKVSTTQSKFGGASYAFDGTGDTISSPDHTDFEFGSGDFTLDLWAYPTVGTGPHDLLSKRGAGNYGSFLIYQVDTTYYFYASSNGSAWDIASAVSMGSVDLSTWTHLAVTRRGSNFYCFKNGVQTATFSSAAAMVNNTVSFNIGSANGGGTYFQGYLDEIRVSKGIARWTSDFASSLPTAPYHSNLVIAEPAIFNYVLTDSEVKAIYESPVAMTDLISGLNDSADSEARQNLFAAAKRTEEISRTNKSLLFNFSGAQTADARVGSFGGVLKKTTAPTNPATTAAEADLDWVGTWSDNGTYRYTANPQAYATYTTAGNATEIWAGHLDFTSYGIAEYIIDEGTAKEIRTKIDQYGTSGTSRYSLIATGLENTRHTIKVRMLNNRNPSSAANGITVGTGTADKMFYYGSTPDIATQDMVVNGRQVKNVLTHDYATMPLATQFPDKGNISEGAHEGTISAWVQTSWAGNDGAYHYLYNTRDASGLNGTALIKYNTNVLMLVFVNASATITLSSAALTASDWAADVPHHLVAKWWRPTTSTMGLAVYLDGKKIAENKSQSFTPSSHSALNIGNYTVVSESYDWDGAIHDLSIWSWPFEDGGIAPGSLVDPKSDVGKSYSGYAVLNEENLSAQADGATAKFNLSRNLKGDAPNDNTWFWAENRQTIDASANDQSVLGTVYDSINDRYYMAGYHYTGANYDAVLWYSSSNNLETATWTKVNIDAAATTEAAYSIIYDSANARYYVIGYYDNGGQYDAVLWYSSSNDLTTATWTKKVVDASASHQVAGGIVYDSVNARYYASGYHHNGSNYDAVVWYSSSNNLTTATWTRVNVDASANDQTGYAGIVYDSVNVRYYVTGAHNNGTDNDAVLWYSSSGDLTTATWTKVNIDTLVGTQIAFYMIYDSANARYLATGYHHNGTDRDAVLWYSSSSDLTTASWTKKVVDASASEQAAYGIVYDSVNSRYYTGGHSGAGANLDATFWQLHLSSDTAQSAADSISVKEDGVLATASSAKKGAFALINDGTGISSTDLSIVIDNIDNEAEIDTTGGYLWLGREGSMRGRELAEYSAYDAGTNTFTISRRAVVLDGNYTFATSWPDNTPLEVCGTVTLSAAPSSGSRVLAEYNFVGSEFDRERGMMRGRLNQNNFLDVTTSATTGWYLSGYLTAKSGGQHISTNVAGQTLFSYFRGSELAYLFSGNSTNGGVAEITLDEGTAQERRLRSDQNNATANQLYEQLFSGLSSGIHSVRITGGVDETNAGSNKYTTFDAFISGAKADLGQSSGDVGEDETKDSNEVNDAFYWPAWKDVESGGGLQLKGEISNSTASLTFDSISADLLGNWGTYKNIDASADNQTAFAITYDSVYDRYIAVGRTGSADENAVLWYSSSSDLSAATWTKVNILATAAPSEGATDIVYDSVNDRYIVVGYVGALDAVLWYSSTNNVATATWTQKTVDGAALGQMAIGIVYDSINSRYYVSGLENATSGGTHYDAAIWYSSSNNVATATWTKKVVDGSAADQYAYKISYDSVNARYYIGGQHVATTTDAVFWYSSSNNLVTATWTRKNIDTDAGSQVALGRIFLNSIDDRYYVSGYDTQSGTAAGVLWFSSSNDLTEAVWTQKTIDSGQVTYGYDLYFDAVGARYVMAGGRTAATLDAVFWQSASDFDRLGRPDGVIKVENEYIKYETLTKTGNNEAILQGLTRGYAGTTAAAHSDNTSFSPLGGWRNNPNAQNTSWGKEWGAFPERALLVGTGTEGVAEGGLAVINLEDNTLWGRFEAHASNAVTSAVKRVSAGEGKIFATYASGGYGLSEIDLVKDQAVRHTTGTSVGYGSAAGTKGLITEANDKKGWSWTGVEIASLITTGGAYVNDVEASFDSSGVSSTFNIWAAQGGSNTTGTAAGVSYVFDEDRDGITSKSFNLTAETNYWVSNLYYDSVNDDLYVAQTKSVAETDIWSKISSPKITANSTIDTADGSDRLTSMPFTYDITADADNLYFATVDGIKKVAKASFSSGVTDTLDSTDFPELPSGNDSYTKLLLHADGLNNQTYDLDYSTSSHTLTFAADAKISTTKSKFGGSSYYLDGTGDYIHAGDSDDFDFGTGDFTIDFWINNWGGSTSSNVLQLADAAYGGSIGNVAADGSLRVYLSSAGASWDIANNVSMGAAPYTDWAHYALVRSGNDFYTFRNGAQVSTFSSSASIYTPVGGVFIFGRYRSTNGSDLYYSSGYLDELRISKGVARWTTDFTPPTEPHHFSARAIDYDTTMNRLICAFDELTVTSAVTGDNAVYYDNTLETDIDRNNSLSSSLFRAAKWLGNFRSGYNGFAIGGNDGMTIGNWIESSESGAGSRIPKAPIIGNTGSFLVF